MATPYDDDIQKQLQSIMNIKNPLMKQAETQGLQTAQARGLGNSLMGVQAARSAMYNTALPMASQAAQQAHAKNLQAQEQAQQTAMQQRELQFQGDLAHHQYLRQMELNKQQQQHEASIAAMNVRSSELEKAGALAAAMESNYSQLMSSLMNNPEIPTQARDIYAQRITAQRNSNMQLVGNLYGVSHVWSHNWGAGA